MFYPKLCLKTFEIANLQIFRNRESQDIKLVCQRERLGVVGPRYSGSLTRIPQVAVDWVGTAVGTGEVLGSHPA